MPAAGLSRRLLLALLGAAIGADIARAQDRSQEASDFILKVGRDLRHLIGNTNDIAEKRRLLGPFLAEVVDVPAVARFCLGRYWAQASAVQQQEYLQLFMRKLTDNVAARLGNYREGQGSVTLLPVMVKADGIYVPTMVTGGDGGPAARVTWVVDNGTEKFHIIDVMAEGISLRLSERNDYSAFLSRHGGDIAAFLDAMRAHTE